MACKDMNAVIDGKAVYVKQWNAEAALLNLNKGLQTFGINFSAFVEGDYTFSDVVRLLAQTDEDKLVPVLKTFVCCARVEGAEITSASFNAHYNGELPLIFKIFAFVCEVQYKDFFLQGVKPQDPDQPQSE